MFVLISIFEIARIMWVYNTLAHAVKETARYAAVHGNDCTVYPNSCGVTVADVARRMSPLLPETGNVLSPLGQGAGLVPDDVKDVEFIWGYDVNTTSKQTCATLTDCLANTTSFPATDDSLGDRPFKITVRAEYEIRTALSLFWPGTSPMLFAPVRLGSSATEMIHF
jgi:hypothetical protein